MALYQADGAELRQMGHTPLVRNDAADDSGENETTLYVFPLTGRAAPEIVVSRIFYGADWTPSHLDVFTCAGGKFDRIASVFSSMPVEVRKAPRGNGCVLRNWHETGVLPCHAEQPRRRDFYAFNGRRFALADAQFPDEFRDYIKEAEAMLRKYPADYDLLQNLAYVYKITGNAQKAEQYYREAERDCREAIAEQGKYGSENDRAILAQIVARNPARPF